MDFRVLDLVELAAAATAIAPLYRMTLVLFKNLAAERFKCSELEERVAELEEATKKRKATLLRCRTQPKNA
jgi:hypothetical protein